MDNRPLPTDIWEAARLIWENTATITDRELIDQLSDAFGEEAPKSSGTISKRRKKEAWQKHSLVKAPKSGSTATKTGAKVEAERAGSKKSRKQKAQNNSLIPSKTNKAQNMESSAIEEARNAVIGDISESVIVNAADRAKVIQKYRRRYHNLGGLFDQALGITLSIPELVEAANQVEAEAMSDVSDKNYGANFEIGENSEPVPSSDVDGVSVVEMANQKVKQAMVLSKSLTDTTTSLAVALKMISEVAMPMMGITADDFKQSEQDRRLGALASLGDIDDKEREARARLVPELHARLLELEQFEASPDFGAEYKDDRSDDEIDEVDYTSVDD